MKIPIKRHTPVRYPMSIYRVALGTYTTYTHDEPTDLDIKRVPNLPVKLCQTVSKVPKYDWTEWHEDMNKQVARGIAIARVEAIGQHKGLNTQEKHYLLDKQSKDVKEVENYDWEDGYMCGTCDVWHPYKKPSLWQRIKRHYKEGLTE